MPKKLTVGEEIIGMKHDICHLRDGQDEIKLDVKSIVTKLDCLDNKFANKWVEKALIGLATTVFAGLAIALITVL